MNANKLIILAAVATVTLLPNAVSAAWSTTPYMKQFNGVEWYFLIDEDTHSASIGTNLTHAAYSNQSLCRATPTALSGKWILPEEFTIDGITYQVTTIGNRALMSDCTYTSLTFPSGVTYLFNCVSYGRKQLKSLCFKGPVTVAAGTQTFSTLETADGTGQVFAQCNALKTVFVGPNIKADSINYTPRFPNSTAYTIFLPRSGDNATWNSYNALGTNPKVIYYGPDEELDFKMGETALTATVRTANALTNVLNHVATFKNDFGLDTKINVTNSIEVASDLITAENMQYATFNSLTFKVNTQAQLDAILSVVPASVPLAIDCSDAKVELTPPIGRKIYALISDEGRNGKYRPKINGLIISFH